MHKTLRVMQAGSWFLVLASATGCTVTPVAPQVVISSASTPVQSATAGPCMSALIEGRLVPASGPGPDLREADGTVRDVIWPDGYTFSSGDKPAVMNAQGETLARVGDSVELGGGESGLRNAWKVCPDHIVVSASSAP